MRLLNYLNESSIITPEQVRKDCSVFIKEMGGRMLFRGTNRNINHVEKIIPRTDRRPTDTPLELHKQLDKAFQKRFGWKARSEGVFVSTSRGQAYGYGNDTLIFMPIGQYEYIYNENIKDLYAKLDPHGVINGTDINEYSDKELEDIVKGYTDKGLSGSKGDGEIMFHCPKGYYLISDEFYKEVMSVQI